MRGKHPFYARFGVGETFSDDGWTVIVFYRPADCIPTDFNMMEFFHLPGANDPGAFACQPTTTDGYETWEGAPGSGQVPKRAYLSGRGAVPVWFVDSAALEAEAEDGVVTIGDLEALNPVKGSAAKFFEILRPGQSNDRPLIIFRAEGDLAEGGTFSARTSQVDGKGPTRIHINQ